MADTSTIKAESYSTSYMPYMEATAIRLPVAWHGAGEQHRQRKLVDAALRGERGQRPIGTN